MCTWNMSYLQSVQKEKEFQMNRPATKCGYCGFILRGSCGTILDHHCFSTYDENAHVINVDENAVVTMRKRHETEDVQHSKEGAVQSTQSILTQDELLIEFVRIRRGLWDHSLPTSERTRLKKDSLWQEIVNAFDGSLSMEAIKQRWKHLRDSYMKARKKMRGYVRSGSGVESGHPLRSSFAHYEEMRFLDDTIKTAPTVSSIQHISEANSSHVDMDNMQVDMTADNLIDFDDSTQNSACSPSESSRKSSCLSPGVKRKNAQRQAEIEDKFLSIIDEVSQKKHDIVDSFMDQLGDILRRLSYVRRRNLQRRLMNIAIEEEDAEFLEKGNDKM
ncbi:hypothetical protein EAG_05682 [Camponotus floridanus]|uniref:MADF domain-containing protein n=1 Tax=Camponotus floridanus TaxID=104421 RepID=E2ABU0_CAMFO|nr:hypothetical protein EAG_05682 [Camponotus floridanus]